MMRIRILLAMLLIASGTAMAQDSNCTDPQTQAEMNICSFEAFEAADAQLNKLWPQVLERARSTDEFIRESDPDAATAEQDMLDAQRAWIRYRDGHCSSQTLRYYGGSIAPLMRNSCAAELTQTRVEQFETYLEEF